jgi:hypothetical protein
VAVKLSVVCRPVRGKRVEVVPIGRTGRQRI